MAKKKSTSKKEVKKEVEEKVSVKETKNKKIDNNTSKGIIIAVLLVAFFAIVFVASNNSGKGKYEEGSNDEEIVTNDTQSESANIKDEEKGELTDTDIKRYLELKKSDDYSIIYIGRPTCSHCEVQKPIMQYMVYKYGVVVNYLNTDELSEKDMTKLQKSDDYFSNGFGTPLILITKSDEIVDKSEGETSIEDLTEMFKKYELIKESGE